MANTSGKGQFTKGDSRINRTGRPKSFDEARKLAQDILAEVIRTDKGEMTRASNIMRKWAESDDYKAHALLFDYAVGKPPSNDKPISFTPTEEQWQSMTDAQLEAIHKGKPAHEVLNGKA